MKKINWLDHVASLLVVILGISIAFYLEGYASEKKEKALEVKYLESLRTDIETDLELIDTLIQVNQYIQRCLNILSNASAGASFEKDSLASYLFSVQYNPPFDAQETTYESLKSSGQMDVIGDFELRSQIVELYEQYYEAAIKYDEIIDDHIRDFVKPHYMKNVTFTGFNQMSSDFLNTSEFRNISFSYRYLFQAKQDFYQLVKKNIEKTLDNLEN